MLHAYIGDGKGKTTAALGLLIRAHSAGMRGAIIFFDKKTEPLNISELITLDKLGIKYYVYGCNRVLENGNFRFGVTQEDINQAKLALKKAEEIVRSNVVDILVLDEVISGMSYKLLDYAQLEPILLLAISKNLELVCTGRCKEAKWLELFDLVSEIKKIKHYFDKGVKARKGIEY